MWLRIIDRRTSVSAASFRPRLTGLAILTVTGATALSLTACGTSNKPNSENTGKSSASASPTPSTPPTSAPAPAEPKDYVEGMITSVSGNVIQLRLRSGTATVDFTPSTEVTEVTPAQLTDVTAGSCIAAEPTQESAPGGAITAQSVTISPAVDDKCLPPPQPPAGSATTPPSAAPNPGVSGKVDSVSGNTITITGTGTGGKTTQTNVTVTGTTTYSKEAPASTQAVTSGKCMGAQGTKNSTGVLQAATIELEPCPPLGRPHHHLPHLPHFHLPHR